MLVEHTHEPLISQEQWDIVQDVRKHKKRIPKHMDESNLFEEELVQIVLDDLRRVTHFARMKEWQFAEYINQKNTLELRREIDRVQKELESAIPAKEEQLERLKASVANVDTFIEKASSIPPSTI